jgi:hypothetical protein
MKALSADVLACITSVRLHVACQKDCRTAANIIALTPDITDLSVHSEETWCVPYESSPEYSRDLINMIFCVGDAGLQFSRLRSLHLKEFKLALLGPVLSQRIDFNKLENLQLILCEDVSRFLSSLKLSQVSWDMLRIEGQKQPGDGRELNSFLQTMTAPKILSIGRQNSSTVGWLEGEKLCWKSLSQHASTLQSLRVSIPELDYSHVPEVEEKRLAEFRTFCRSVSNLDQLALISPQIESDEWGDEHGFYTLLVRAPNCPWTLRLVLTDYSGLFD